MDLWQAEMTEAWKDLKLMKLLLYLQALQRRGILKLDIEKAPVAVLEHNCMNLKC